MKTTLIYKVISEMPLQKTFQRTLQSNNSTLSVFEEEVRKQFSKYDVKINHAGKAVTVDVHDYADEELNLSGDDYSDEI